MCLFFTDLDNTMIYSHHKDIGETKIVVEYLNGYEQSFMTEYTYGFLSSAKWLTVIPLTSRSEQQYRRVESCTNLHFKYAILCNGGKLLIDGKESVEWSRETDDIAQGSYDSMENATSILSKLYPAVTIHSPEKYMSYVKCDHPEEVYTKLRKLIDCNKVNIQRDNRKVYIFANGITKGAAIERFTKSCKNETVIAAGDNLMDVSMLNVADISFAKQDIFDVISCKTKVKIDDIPFSDGICKSLNEMKLKGVL